MSLKERTKQRPRGFPSHPKGSIDWIYLGISMAIPATAWIMRTHILQQPLPTLLLHYAILWFFGYSLLCGLRTQRYRAQLSDCLWNWRMKKQGPAISNMPIFITKTLGTGTFLICGLIILITFSAILASIAGFAHYTKLIGTMSIFAGCASVWYWTQILFSLLYFQTPERTFIIVDNMSFSPNEVFALYPWYDHHFEILREEIGRRELSSK